MGSSIVLHPSKQPYQTHCAALPTPGGFFPKSCEESMKMLTSWKIQSHSLKSHQQVAFGDSPKVTLKVTPKSAPVWPETKSLKVRLLRVKQSHFGLLGGDPTDIFWSLFAWLWIVRGFEGSRTLASSLPQNALTGPNLYTPAPNPGKYPSGGGGCKRRGGGMREMGTTCPFGVFSPVL